MQDFAEQQISKKMQEDEYEAAEIIFRTAEAICYKDYFVCSEINPIISGKAYDECIETFDGCKRKARKNHRIRLQTFKDQPTAQ